MKDLTTPEERHAILVEVLRAIHSKIRIDSGVGFVCRKSEENNSYNKDYWGANLMSEFESPNPLLTPDQKKYISQLFEKCKTESNHRLTFHYTGYVTRRFTFYDNVKLSGILMTWAGGKGKASLEMEIRSGKYSYSELDPKEILAGNFDSIRPPVYKVHEDHPYHFDLRIRDCEDNMPLITQGNLQTDVRFDFKSFSFDPILNMETSEETRRTFHDFTIDYAKNANLVPQDIEFKITRTYDSLNGHGPEDNLGFFVEGKISRKFSNEESNLVNCPSILWGPKGVVYTEAVGYVHILLNNIDQSYTLECTYADDGRSGPLTCENLRFEK